MASGTAEGRQSTISQGSTVTSSDGKYYTLSFIVQPAPGESVKDFHLVSEVHGKKLPGSPDFGQPANWNTGVQKKSKGQPTTIYWTAQGDESIDGDPDGVGPQAGEQGTFTIRIKKSDYGWYQYNWYTTKDGDTKVTTGPTGNVIKTGTYGPATGNGGEGIPLTSAAITGPTTVAISTAETYLIENPIENDDTTSMTIYVSRSLISGDPTRVNRQDLIPTEWNIGLSTNSRTGTTHINPGTISATYFGDERNRLILDVPNSVNLIGMTIYIEVEFSNGDETDAIPVTFTG